MSRVLLALLAIVALATTPAAAVKAPAPLDGFTMVDADGEISGHGDIAALEPVDADAVVAAAMHPHRAHTGTHQRVYRVPVFQVEEMPRAGEHAVMVFFLDTQSQSGVGDAEALFQALFEILLRGNLSMFTPPGAPDSCHGQGP